MKRARRGRRRRACALRRPPLLCQEVQGRGCAAGAICQGSPSCLREDSLPPLHARDPHAVSLGDKALRCLLAAWVDPICKQGVCACSALLREHLSALLDEMGDACLAYTLPTMAEMMSDALAYDVDVAFSASMPAMFGVMRTRAGMPITSSR